MKKHHYEPIPPNVLQVLNHVATIFNTSVGSILHKNRLKNNVEARHTAMFYLYQQTSKQKSKFTKKQIGCFFGGRDHTSVIHALQNVQNWLDIYPDFVERYTALEKACKHISLKRGELTLAERIERLPQNEREGILAYIEKLEKK